MRLPLIVGSSIAGQNNSNSNNDGSCVNNNLKLIGVAVLCFVGGLQLDRESSMQFILSRLVRSSGISPQPTSVVTTATDADAEDADADADAADDVQMKLESTKPVEQIILLGERHSGTNWITDHLADCFGESVKVNERYKRVKHWFQEEDLTRVPENSAVVVVMFRDPYDWVEAMRVEPHHSHDHINWPTDKIDYNVGWRQQGALPLEWKDFVTKPWIGQRGAMDWNISRTQEGMKTAKCLDEYKFVDAAPCSANDSRIVMGLGEYKYEFQHDGSEKGFASIVDLRRAKIINHLSVADFLGTRALFSYRFEDLNHNGTATLLKNVEEATGIKAKCNATLGNARRRLQGRNKPIVKHGELPDDYIQWMNRFVHWDMESRIGYAKRE